MLDVGFGRGWTALEEARVDGEEEGFGVGERCAVGGEEVGGVEEFAGAFAAEVAGGEGEQGVEGGGAKVIDAHVAGHGEEAEGTVELAHGFVEQGGDDAAVDVAGRPLVELGELDGGGGGDLVFAGWWWGVDGEAEMEALRIGGAAAEAMGGEFVDGEVVELFGEVGHAGERIRPLACVREGCGRVRVWYSLRSWRAWRGETLLDWGCGRGSCWGL